MNIKHHRASTAEHPPLVATRLLDQLRERIRYLHYSLRTEQACPVREAKGGKECVVMPF